MSIETDYKKFTLQEIVDFVKSHPMQFSKGMDTKVVTGDFEGNYYHNTFMLDADGTNLFIGFELHD